MILATPRGAREVRGATGEFGSSAVPPPGSGGSWGSLGSWAGVTVDAKSAYGMPVVAQAISLIANGIGVLPMMVYRRDTNDQIAKATRAWQYKLLHDHPTEQAPPFWFYGGVTRSLLTCGNAYLLKSKDRAAGRISSLQLLQPSRVMLRVNRETGQKEYLYRDDQGRQYGPWGEQQVLHVIGETTEGAEEYGIGVIQRHMQTLGAGLAQEEYKSSYFRNGANPGLVIYKDGLASEQLADEWMNKWKQRHQGVANAFNPTVVPTGSKVEKISMTLEDMAFVELQKFTVSDVARMFSVPPALLGQSDVTRPVLEDNQVLFNLHALMPWMTRIEQAFQNDDDLFGAGPLYPEFLADALMRPSTVARYQAYLQGRQAGWLSVNDIRRFENMPPIDGGDLYQAVPVGGTSDLMPGQGNGAQGTSDGDTADQARMLRRDLDVEFARRDAELQRALTIMSASGDRSIDVRPEINLPPVHVDAPVLQVHVPPHEPPDFHVSIPEQPRPIVNVPAPQVHVDVNVPEVEPPVVNTHTPVHLPAPAKPRSRRINVIRDASGRAVSYEVIEEDEDGA